MFPKVIFADEFADDFEKLYGKINVSMNIHLMRHIAHTVRCLGPLWNQSTFCFETFNGSLVHSRTSTLHWLQQISWNYSMKFTLKNSSEITHLPISLGKTEKILFEECDVKTLNEFGFIEPGGTFNVYIDLSLYGKRFSSKNSKEVSTIDFFIYFDYHQKIGAIKYFFLSENQTYAMVETYDKIEHEDQFIEIQNDVRQINEKLIYLNINNKEYVTSIPNHYEKT